MIAHSQKWRSSEHSNPYSLTDLYDHLFSISTRVDLLGPRLCIYPLIICLCSARLLSRKADFCHQQHMKELTSPHARNSWHFPAFQCLPSNHLILYRPLLLLPSVFSSIRVFSNELALRIRWPKNWSVSISPSNEYLGLISFKIDWFGLLAVQGTLKSLLQSPLNQWTWV